MERIVMLFFVVALIAKENCAANVWIVNHPINISVKLGGVAALQCTFNTVVFCSWFRGTQLVAGYKNHDKRYVFLGGHEGLNTTDCSLGINPVQREDVGNWKCSSSASDNMRSVHSNIVMVSISYATTEKSGTNVSATKVTTIVEQAAPVEIGDLQPGSPALLSCQPGLGSPCVWKRQKQRVEITGRYKRISNSTNCDFLIRDAKPTDFGKWICTSVGDDQSRVVILSYVTLYSAQGHGTIWKSSIAGAAIICTLLLCLLTCGLRTKITHK